MVNTNGSDLNALLSALHEDKNLIRKFEVYAEKLLYKRTKNKFALHFCPSDFVSSITFKLLNGDINWDNEQCSLSCFFFRRIRTDIFNLTRKEIKFIPVPLEKSAIINDYTGKSDDDISEPPELIIYPFEENDDKDEIDPVEFKKIALETFLDSDESYCVLDEMLKGLKPNQIARSLGLTKNKVYYYKRHINRILKEKFNPAKLELTKEDKPLNNSLLENNPGDLTPDNNNNGELI
jgi:hypothetical protein